MYSFMDSLIINTLHVYILNLLSFHQYDFFKMSLTNTSFGLSTSTWTNTGPDGSSSGSLFPLSLSVSLSASLSLLLVSLALSLADLSFVDRSEAELRADDDAERDIGDRDIGVGVWGITVQ